jgi:hypothetical protein
MREEDISEAAFINKIAYILRKELPDTTSQNKTKKARDHHSKMEQLDIRTQTPYSLQQSTIETQTENIYTSPKTEIFEMPKCHEIGNNDDLYDENIDEE